MQSDDREYASKSTSAKSWFAVLSVAAGTFLLVTSEFLPVGLLTGIASSLGISEGRAGLSITVPGLVAAIAAPGLTILASRFDRRLMLVSMTILICVSNVIVAFSDDVYTLLIGRVFLGIAVGGFWTFAVVAGRRLVDEKSGARATAIISAGISIGMILGVPAGSQLGQWLGWRQAFLFNAGVGVVVLIGQVIFVPSMPVKDAPGMAHMRLLLTVAKARLGLLATSFLFCGQFAGYTYFEPFLRMFIGANQQALTRLLFTYGLFGIFGNFFAEFAAAKGIRRAFIGLAAALGGTVLVGGLFVNQITTAYILSAAWGFAFGSIPVCMQIWMFQAAPQYYEAGAASFVSVSQIALALGAFSGGLMIDLVGPRGTLAGAGILCLFAALLLAWLSENPRTANPSSLQNR